MYSVLLSFKLQLRIQYCCCFCTVSISRIDLFTSFTQVNEVLTEVSLIKDRQEDIDGKLDTMKNENEALWREVEN